MRDHIAPKSIDPRATRRCQHVQVHGACGREVPEDAPVALCMPHIAAAWQFCQDQISKRREATHEQDWADRHRRAEELAIQAVAEKRAIAEKLAADPTIDDHESVVYYIRFGDRIKIGFSRALGTRLTSLPFDELLAIEPGARKVETRRHAQFAESRIRGEWFSMAPDLLAHIDQLRLLQDERMAWVEKWTKSLQLVDRFEGRRSDQEILEALT